MAGGPRTTPSENLGLLGMLDDNPTLRKLISTWRNAYLAGGKKEEQIAKWARLTLLRPLEIEASWDAIFDNGFCTRDGKVDEAANKYLAQRALAGLPKSPRQKPPPGGTP